MVCYVDNQRTESIIFMYTFICFYITHHEYIFPSTHCERNKMTVILQTTFLNDYSFCMTFWLKVLWNMFPMVRWTIKQHCFRRCLGTQGVTSLYLNTCWNNLLSHIRHEDYKFSSLSDVLNAISPYGEALYTEEHGTTPESVLIYLAMPPPVGPFWCPLLWPI